MTRTVKPRPIQPSVIKQLAQFFALLDPRCTSDAHNRVAQGESCPTCGMSLWAYVAAMPKDWPDA